MLALVPAGIALRGMPTPERTHPSFRRRLAGRLDRLNASAANLAAWLQLPIMVIIVFDVIMRRFLDVGSVMLQELEWHLNAVLFLFTMAYTYGRNLHVRIDIVRHKFSERSRDAVEIIGALVFLMPFAALIVWLGTGFTLHAWSMGEVSDAPGGLPYRWLMKAAVPVAFALLFFQGWVEAVRRNMLWPWLVALFVVSAFFRLLDAPLEPALAVSLEEWLPLLMFAVLAVLLFAGYPVAFTLAGVGIAFGVVGLAAGVFSLPEFNNVLLRIWGGLVQNLILVAIPMFVFMGIMLERGGVAADLLESLQQLMARIPGGLAIAVTVLGTILAASTGIIGASVVMLGVLALPAMLENHYRTELAVGVLCASGTLGILIPPSIMLVLMGDLLSLPVGELFVGALVPGLLLSALYIAYLITTCAVRPSLAPPRPPRHDGATARAPILGVLQTLVPPLSMIALVLGSIFFGWATPTEASGVGAVGAIALAAMYRRLTPSMFKEVVARSAATVSMIFTILIGATTFSYVFRSLGGDDVVATLFANLELGPWEVLLAVMAVIFLLGFFFDWLEITLIVLPLFAPIIGQLDFGGDLVDPRRTSVWFAILVAINLQTSFLTPPFGFALFYLKGTCPPQVTTAQIYRGVVPFVFLQLLALALVMLFPSLVTWLPSVLFR